ncbi:methyl-accepting chemotaxis protein, partial [Pseudoalteromonas sp. Angola-31]|nr:methyl-accepting chemotaxis protein [Pseudoalteromonas sp. Angola-31]
TSLLSTIFIIAFVLLGIVFRKIFIVRLKKLGHAMHLATTNKDLTLRIEDNAEDELGWLATSFNQMIATFKDNIAQVSHSSKVLIHSAEKIYTSADTTERAILEQKKSTDSVAAAINELESSSNEVRNTTNFAQEKSENSNELA